MPGRRQADKVGLLGLLAVAVVCCAGGPLIVAAIGGFGVAVWLGAGGGAVLLALAIAAIYPRARRSTALR